MRCANFFENLNWGINTPYHEDIKLPYISSFEIADVAANYLNNLNFTEISVDELMGRKDYTMGEFARMLGIRYKQLLVMRKMNHFLMLLIPEIIHLYKEQ